MSARGKPQLVARLVWASLLGTVPLYCAALVVLLGSGAGDPKPALADRLRAILLVLAAGQTLAIWLVWRRFVAPAGYEPAERTDAQRVLTMQLVCWALCETIALSGFVIGLIARRIEPVFFVWALAALLVLRPRSESAP